MGAGFAITDTASILDVLARVTTFVAFLVFIVPGFLSLRAFEAKRGGVSRKINEWLVDGGRYIPPGFASHYTADEQLQVGEMWEMGQESGWFKNRLEGSLGFLINMKDVLTIEFVEWKNVIPLGETSAPSAGPLANGGGDDDKMSSNVAEIGAP